MGKKKGKVKGVVAGAAVAVKNITLEEIQEAAAKGQASVLKKIFNYVEQNPDQIESVKFSAAEAARDAGKNDLEAKIERREHDGPNYNAWIKEQEKIQARIEADKKKQIEEGSAFVIENPEFDESGNIILSPKQMVEFARGKINYLIANMDQVGFEDFIRGYSGRGLVDILKTTLEIAIQNDSAEFVELAISKMEPNTLEGESSLHNMFFFAVGNKKNNAAKALAKVQTQGDLGLDDVMVPPKGVSLDMNQGATFFHRIVEKRTDPDLIEILLDKGANYMVLNKAGESPLCSALCGEEKVAEIFIKRASVEELSAALGIITRNSNSNKHVSIKKEGEILGLVEFDPSQLNPKILKLLDVKFGASQGPAASFGADGGARPTPPRSTSPVASAAAASTANRQDSRD